MPPMAPTRSFRTIQPLIRSRAAYQAQQARLFSQSTKFFDSSRSNIRPQLPFLHGKIPQIGKIQARLSRFLTEERRKEWKYNFWLWVKVCSAALFAKAMWIVLQIGLQHRDWEARFPEPPEYSIWTKWIWRFASGAQNPGYTNSIVSWLQVGNSWKDVLARLEDPEIDGAGIRPRLGDGEVLSVPGVGDAGWDISAKSEKWKRGYYTALMSAAKAAENLDGWLKDPNDKRPLAFPAETVPGPSNPRPRPVRFGTPEAPKEEDCVVAFEEPQVFYMKVLTTEGFTSGQKLNAALAYADFLQFKRLFSSAADMIEWGIDIATANAPANVIDKKTGIIQPNATGVTENIILAASAMAMHKAQTGDLPQALPIYLSILRAQRSLPPADPTSFAKATPIKHASTGYWGKIVDFFDQPPYPEAPPTGDEPATRLPIASCNEAATMAHIGEILFASSYALPSGSKESAVKKSQETGLSWTRDSFELAEATIKSMADTPLGQIDSVPEKEAKERCVECLAMTIDNWKKMLEPLREAEKLDVEKAKAAAEAGEGKSSGWSLWGTKNKEVVVEDGMGRWEKEEGVVAAREIELKALLRREGLHMGEFI